MRASLLFVLVTSVLCDDFEYRLFSDLAYKHNPLERPVSNNSEPVVVTLNVLLQQLVGLDEKTQVLQLNVWLKYIWTDYKLQWDPDAYGGITDIRYPLGSIWKPDILIYNSADSEWDSTYESNMVVYNDGTINWIPPGILQVGCQIDITWYPFDDQLCYIKFGSWTFHGFALNLQAEADGMDTQEYLVNDQWILLETFVERNEKFYTCCPEPYPTLKFYIRLRRRTLYYGINVIIPSLVISLMTILGFTLPSGACEKITLETTVLLTICFFLEMVKNMTPATSEALPLIVVFFTTCMLIVSASCVFTVIVVNIHFRTPESHEMTDFTRTVLLNWLPWLLLMRRPGQAFKKPFENATDSESEDDADSLEGKIDASLRDFQLIRNGENGLNDNQASVMILECIHKEIAFIKEHMEEDDRCADIRNDWKFAAMVVDRLCLVVFSILLSISTCAILFSAPHLNA